MKTIVVLISGNGSNLQALIDACKQRNWPATIAGVISDKAEAYGLQRAAAAGIASHIIQKKPDHPELFEQQLQQTINQYRPDLIVLAGFMRILSADWVAQYDRKIINIHPSLLPKYRGLNTHERAYHSQDTVHGASVHFVTAELDGGPVILQRQFTIEPHYTLEDLAAHTQRIEHDILVQAVEWLVLDSLPK